MALKSIQEEWEGFAAMIFQKMQPHPSQIVEMQKAFFAGAWAMFNAMVEIGDTDILETDSVKYLEERRAECLEFKRRLMAEYAERN